MNSVHFEYEISADEYVAAQLLYHKLQGGQRHTAWAACWILAGVVLIVMAWNGRAPAWAPFVPSLSSALFLLAAIGAWWIYASVRSLYPARYYRRSYRSFEYAGKSFKASLDDGGFQVEGEFCEWHVKWPGVRLKGEGERVFIFLSGGTIFIFGKKYLSEEQQRELRRLSGLKAP